MTLILKIFKNNNYLKILVFSILLNSCSSNEKSKIYSEEIQTLVNYVQDKSDFNYTIKDTIKYNGASLYRIKMDSGKWLTKELVNEPLWWHWIDVVVPDSIDTSASLLFIGGGSKFENGIFLDSLSVQKAIKTKSIISHVSNIPFQPLKFQSYSLNFSLL